MPTIQRLSETTLYLGDNGRATCGRLRCAGATAYYSGHDLSGQSLLPLTSREAIDHDCRCEGCGMQPMLVAGGR